MEHTRISGGARYFRSDFRHMNEEGNGVQSQPALGPPHAKVSTLRSFDSVSKEHQERPDSRDRRDDQRNDGSFKHPLQP